MDAIAANYQLLKMAGFHLPRPGRFCPPGDTGHETGISDHYVRRKPTMVQDACAAIERHYFGEVTVFNISRGHWVACDECGTCMFIGSNLWSSWRSETEVVWRKNHASVEGYECVGCGE